MIRGPAPLQLFAFQADASLWEDGLQAFNLAVNMRQRTDHTWVGDLNALRTCCVQHDVDEALQRLRPRQSVTTAPRSSVGEAAPDIRADPWCDAVHIFPRTRAAAAHNQGKLHELHRRGQVVRNISASHAELLHSGAVSNRRVAADSLPRTADECGGLEAYVSLAVGARVMLRRNVDTADGLVNGAIGRIHDFELSGVPGAESVQAVFVVFDSPSLGRIWRETRGVTDDRAPVGITRTTSAFTASSGRMVQRTQFALSLAWGVTVHKTQGLSMDTAVLDLGDSLFAAGQAYVALSRVRTRDGVALLALAARQKICQINQDVLRYYQRLGFVEPVCDEDEDEEGGRRRRSSGRLRERERVRWHEQQRDAHGHEGEGEQQRQQQQQQQQQGRGRRRRGGRDEGGRSQSRDNVGERARQDTAHVAVVAQQASSASRARGRPRGARGRGGGRPRGRARTTASRGGRGRGERLADAMDVVAGSAASVLTHVGEALNNPASGPPRPQPLPLQVPPLSSLDAERVRAAQVRLPARSWPPSAYELTRVETVMQNGVSVVRRAPNTFSWLFVPVISHALNMGHLHPHLPASDPQLAPWIQALAAAFQSYGITWAGLQQQGHVLAGNYLSAQMQEQLLGMAPAAGQGIQLYGIQIANAAVLQLQGQGAVPPIVDESARRVRQRREEDAECSSRPGSTIHVRARAGTSPPP